MSIHRKTSRRAVIRKVYLVEIRFDDDLGDKAIAEFDTEDEAKAHIRKLQKKGLIDK